MYIAIRISKVEWLHSTLHSWDGEPPPVESILHLCRGAKETTWRSFDVAQPPGTIQHFMGN
jgi:hypothetical protein